MVGFQNKCALVCPTCVKKYYNKFGWIRFRNIITERERDAFDLWGGVQAKINVLLYISFWSWNVVQKIIGIALVKFFRIIPEFRILRLTFHRKSASKC